MLPLTVSKIERECVPMYYPDTSYCNMVIWQSIVYGTA
jgi:hypothetical protein